MGLVEDVQLHLQQQSPPVIDSGSPVEWPSFRRRVIDRIGTRDVHQIVVFTEDGGFEPEMPSPQGVGDASIRQPAVQVRVRGEPWDGDSASEKLAEIADILGRVLREQIGYTTYQRIKAQSEPLFIGFDEKNRPEFTQSFRAFLFQ
jgi:hypothetical protein